MHQLTGTPGHILAILSDGQPRTRRELSGVTGQARSTVGQRLDTLMRAGLVNEAEGMTTTGGRPSVTYAFHSTGMVALAVDLDSDHAVCAITDLAGSVIAHSRIAIDVSRGPRPVLGELGLELERLHAVHGDDRDVLVLGIGLPGPVDRITMAPVSPPIMPGWDGFPVSDVLGRRFGCPVIVDNDANILAMGERKSVWPDEQDLIFVKISSGIGVGIVSGGHLLHGAEGAAGDLGHVGTLFAAGRRCRCGNHGCLEAVAGGMSIASILTAAGFPAATPADVIDLVRAGNLHAVQVLREAGRALGDVLAGCTALLNPRLIVVGGPITQVGEPLLAGIRECIYTRALPLASRNLRVVVAQSGPLAGVVGAAHMALGCTFAADAFPETLARISGPHASIA